MTGSEKMSLEDRLADHLRSTGDGLRAPEPDPSAVAVASGRRLTRSRLAMIAAAVTALGLVAVAVVWLPAVLERLDRNAEPTRIVVSPFVEVEDLWTAQADVVLFTATVDEPSYWRLATLDSYGFDIWKVSGSFEEVDGVLPGPADTIDPATVGGTVRSQTVELAGLDAIWLPVIPEPVELVETTRGVTFAPSIGTLAVEGVADPNQVVRYTVRSGVSALTPARLREATGSDPERIQEQFLFLGSADLSPGAAGLASEITAGATTRFDRALALQDHFRSFDVGPGLESVSDLNGSARIDAFLADRAGTGREFAGTFALMARALGIPSRVAVGFTSGDPTADPTGDPATYEIRGRHAHVWPELYFPGVGWVSFEPTPGFGNPVTTGYTGAPAGQPGGG